MTSSLNRRGMVKSTLTATRGVAPKVRSAIASAVCSAAVPLVTADQKFLQAVASHPYLAAHIIGLNAVSAR